MSSAPPLTASRERSSSRRPLKISTEPAGQRRGEFAWWSAPAALWSVALCGLVLYAGLYLLRVATIAAYPFDLDQGEGYDVFSGLALLQGRPIYTTNESFPYYSSNYPPVYSLLVALTAMWTGPTLLAGRLVSIVAWLLVAIVVFEAANRRAGAFAGFVSAGLLLASTYAFHTTPLARVNALTGLFSLAGLLALDGRWRGRLVAGGLLLLLAVYTKPTAVDAAAAGLVGVWLEDRRAALWLGAGLAAAGLGLMAVLQEWSGGAFVLNVFQGNVNPFIPDQLFAYLGNFALLHFAVLLLAAVEVVRAAWERRIEAIHLLLVTGLLMALGVGKWGAGESYFQSAIVAASLLAGPGAAWLLKHGRVGLGWLAPLAVVAQLVVGAHGDVVGWHPWLEDRGLQGDALGLSPTAEDERRGWELVRLMRQAGAPVLSEDPGFLVAAGLPVVGNATHLRNLHQAGLWRPEALVTDVRARRYHMVALHAELYPEPVLQAIGQSYYLDDVLAVYRGEQEIFLPGQQ
ncbi:MAG: hypothetical protein IT307_17755 [Chloroflexi bacterium]|nr:hypothetical protein [Chloroflexota bacterium]